MGMKKKGRRGEKEGERESKEKRKEMTEDGWGHFVRTKECMRTRRGGDVI